MPKKYVIEMFIDRVSASKNYQKEAYTDASAWEYYERSKSHYALHPDTQKLLEELLWMIKEQGEESVYYYIKNIVLAKDFSY